MQYHIEHSCEGRCKPLRFVNGNKEELLLADTLDYFENMKENCPVNLYQESILYEKLTSSLLMTEIQLKNIVDRMGADPDTKTDGDETTVNQGWGQDKQIL